MNEFHDPIPYRARQALVRAAQMFGMATGWKALEDARAARGRHDDGVVKTFKVFRAAFVAPAIIFAIYVAVTGRGGIDLHMLFFIVLAPVFAAVAVLSAWTVTLISLGAVEVAHSARRTPVAPRGHLLTLEEVRAQQLYWADIAFGEDPVVTDPTLRSEALAKLNETMELSEKIANGTKVWIDDGD